MWKGSYQNRHSLSNWILWAPKTTCWIIPAILIQTNSCPHECSLSKGMLVNTVNKTKPWIFRCSTCLGRRIEVVHSTRPFGWVLFEKCSGSCASAAWLQGSTLYFVVVGWRPPRMDAVSSSDWLSSGLQQAKVFGNLLSFLCFRAFSFSIS